jgi:hypothetical protein
VWVVTEVADAIDPDLDSRFIVMGWEDDEVDDHAGVVATVRIQ